MKRLKIWAGSVALAAFALAAPFQAHAEIVKIAIEAEVTEVIDTIGVLAGKIKVGDIIRGHYIYDTATEDDVPAVPSLGTYWMNTKQNGISLEINGYYFSTHRAANDPDGFLMQILNDYYPGEDVHLIRSYTNRFDLSAPPGMHLENHISWDIRDLEHNSLTTDAMPTEAPYLPSWQQNRIDITSSNLSVGPKFFYIFGQVRTAQKVLHSGKQ